MNRITEEKKGDEERESWGNRKEDRIRKVRIKGGEESEGKGMEKRRQERRNAKIKQGREEGEENKTEGGRQKHIGIDGERRKGC